MMGNALQFYLIEYSFENELFYDTMKSVEVRVKNNINNMAILKL